MSGYSGVRTVSGHTYLTGVLEEQTMPPISLLRLRRLRDGIETRLRRTFGSAPRIYYGGSYGKDTMIKASFDLDIVMYLPPDDPRTLRQVFNGVHANLLKAGYAVKPKTVSLQLGPSNVFHVDVVPGKAQDNTYYYATLYKNVGQGSTMQTSIKKHIDTVSESGARDIIKLMKLWRVRHAPFWKTFPLEQTVIRALHGRRKDDYEQCVLTVLEFIRDEVQDVRLVDPANSANVIEIPPLVRRRLKALAIGSLAAQYWRQVIW